MVAAKRLFGFRSHAIAQSYHRLALEQKHNLND